jgi:rhodanese-related sulfurtransferase
MNTITPKDLKSTYDSDNSLQIIDCREPEEFVSGTIAGAINIPMSVFNQQYKELDNSKEIYMICRSGQRSRRACSFLEANQYQNVTNVTGGVLAWHALGLPLIDPIK